jgi:hypothetical protein
MVTRTEDFMQPSLRVLHVETRRKGTDHEVSGLQCLKSGAFRDYQIIVGSG